MFSGVPPHPDSCTAANSNSIRSPRRRWGAAWVEFRGQEGSPGLMSEAAVAPWIISHTAGSARAIVRFHCTRNDARKTSLGDIMKLSRRKFLHLAAGADSCGIEGKSSRLAPLARVTALTAL